MILGAGAFVSTSLISLSVTCSGSRASIFSSVSRVSACCRPPKYFAICCARAGLRACCGEFAQPGKSNAPPSRRTSKPYFMGQCSMAVTQIASRDDEALQFEDPVLFDAEPYIRGEEDVFAVGIEMHGDVLVRRRDGCIIVDPVPDLLAFQEMFGSRHFSVLFFGWQPDVADDRMAAGVKIIQRPVTKHVAAEQIIAFVKAGELFHGVGDCAQREVHVPLIRKKSRQPAGTHRRDVRKLQTDDGPRFAGQRIGDFVAAFAFPGQWAPDFKSV